MSPPLLDDLDGAFLDELGAHPMQPFPSPDEPRRLVGRDFAAGSADEFRANYDELPGLLRKQA